MKAVKLSPSDIENIISDRSSQLNVILFDAEFTQQGDIVNSTLSIIEEVFPQVRLSICDAEQHHEFASKNQVITLPCIALFRDGKVIKKSTDFDPERLKNFIKQAVGVEKSEKQTEPKDRLVSYMEDLIKSAPIMIFMKGKPSQPRCGFSKQLVELMARNDLKFDSFDILENEEVRQGLKEYSNWPTYPQVYANGEFIGGLDILKQLEESNELVETLTGKSTKSDGDS